MNALPEGISRPPNRSDYEPIIKGMRSFIQEEELTLRCSLMLMRDQAMGRKRHACEPAWMLLDVIQRVAGDNAMNERVDVDTLKELRRLCLNTACAASSFDTLFAPRLPLDEGEANGRG